MPRNWLTVFSWCVFGFRRYDEINDGEMYVGTEQVSEVKLIILQNRLYVYRTTVLFAT